MLRFFLLGSGSAAVIALWNEAITISANSVQFAASPKGLRHIAVLIDLYSMKPSSHQTLIGKSHAN